MVLCSFLCGFMFLHKSQKTVRINRNFYWILLKIYSDTFWENVTNSWKNQKFVYTCPRFYFDTSAAFCHERFWHKPGNCQNRILTENPVLSEKGFWRMVPKCYERMWRIPGNCQNKNVCQFDTPYDFMTH